MLAAQRLHRGLQPEAGLGLVELHPAALLAHLLQPALGVGPLATVTVELGRRRPHLLTLAVALLGEVVVLGVEHELVAGDDLVQPVEGRERGLQPQPSLLGVGPGVLVGQQALLDLREPLLQEVVPLGEPGGAHRQLATAVTQRPGALLEQRHDLLAGPNLLGLGQLVGLQPGQHRLQLGDPRPLPAQPLPHLTGAGGHDVGLAGQLAPLGLRPGQLLGGRGEPGVGDVEAAGQLVLGVAGGLCRDASRGQGIEAPAELGLGRRGLGPGLFERRTRRPGAVHADAPGEWPEPVAVPGHDDGAGMGQGGVEGTRPAVDDHRGTEEPVEQPGHVGVTARDVAAQRLTQRRR